MVKKKLEESDLVKLVKLVDEVAALHLKYIEEGFLTGEIAETFATIYFRRFEQTLDEEGVKCLKCEQSTDVKIYGSNTKFEATGRMCIHLASGFLKAVAAEMAKHNRT